MKKNTLIKLFVTSFWRESSTINFGEYMTAQVYIVLNLCWIFKYKYKYFLIEIYPSDNIRIRACDYGSYIRTGFFGKKIHNKN